MLPLHHAFTTAAPTAKTTNGMAAYAHTGSHLLEMFFQMGALRSRGPHALVPLLASAWGENPELALKALFYHRDVRGGQGERDSFREGFRWLIERAPTVARAVLPLVPVYGRWDDVLVAIGSPLEADVITLVKGALARGDALCAKWLPREGKRHGKLADTLRKGLGVSWKEYRQLLARNTKVVETLMCSGRWADVNYNHVPSQAVHRYRRAFKRHDDIRYTQWLTDVTNKVEGTKINAATLFPHQLLQGVTHNPQADAQWKALPNYCTTPGAVLPVLDVSGSMGHYDAANSPMQVCVGLGLYLAERLQGPFQDHFVTFSSTPEFHYVPSTLPLATRLSMTVSAPWGMNTNLEAVFQLILQRAKQAGLTDEALPKVVLVISDMQFDHCATYPGASALQMLRQQFADAGYTMPSVVFWNVNAYSKSAPATVNDRGVALVSGYSPSIMTRLLENPTDLSPYGIVLSTLLADRYAAVKLPR